MSSGAWRWKNASAIWDRPALWVQTKSTYFMGSSEGGRAVRAESLSIDKRQLNRYM